MLNISKLVISYRIDVELSTSISDRSNVLYHNRVMVYTAVYESYLTLT